MSQIPFPYTIIDANLNRISEGLRVIEEYTRFISQNKAQTDQLSALRKKIASKITEPHQLLNIRNVSHDMRAYEEPSKRNSLIDILTANFKRVTQALRVLEEYSGDADFNRMRYDMYTLEKQVLLPLYQKPLPRGIYAISDTIDHLISSIYSGASLIQLRDKHASKHDIYQKAQALKTQLSAIPQAATIPLIINDHIDIAIAIDADGLHTGQDDIPIAIQRQLLGPHKIIGRTTHSLNQGLDAQAQGADYVSVGPIYETPSKPNRDGIGLNYLQEAITHLTIPYVAIGGINLKTIDSILYYNPPLIGLIRAHDDIPLLLKKINS
jgi:thiamine-phosphate pyrophosphorylase